MDVQPILEVTILVVVLVLVRIFYLMHKITTGFSRKASCKRSSPCRTIICIGSGGHTTEMLKLVETLDFSKYYPRHYYIADNDTTSIVKVQALEKAKSTSTKNFGYLIVQIPRSRVVNQSYITSVATTIYSFLRSIPPVLLFRPELILCNGPGTCIPICVLGFLLKVTFIIDTRIVFIESFCRTQTLSLTGKILLYFADNFLVQWPNLQKKFKRTEYIGQLM